MDISNRIEEYLKKNDMTQRQLARRLGIHEINISRYISGERIPKVTVCIAMAKILCCKVEDLYTISTTFEDINGNTPDDIDVYRQCDYITHNFDTWDIVRIIALLSGVVYTHQTKLPLLDGMNKPNVKETE